LHKEKLNRDKKIRTNPIGGAGFSDQSAGILSTVVKKEAWPGYAER
jgi:hypothetical protein